jgi:hypothetical protein
MNKILRDSSIETYNVSMDKLTNIGELKYNGSYQSNNNYSFLYTYISLNNPITKTFNFLKSVDNYITYIKKVFLNKGPVFFGICTRLNNKIMFENSPYLSGLDNQNLSSESSKYINFLILISFSYLSKLGFSLKNFTISLLKLNTPVDLNFKYGEIDFNLTNVSEVPVFLPILTEDDLFSFEKIDSKNYLIEIKNYNNMIFSYISMKFSNSSFPLVSENISDIPLYVFLDTFILSFFKDFYDICTFSNDNLNKIKNSYCNELFLNYGSVHNIDNNIYIKLSEVKSYSLNLTEEIIENIILDKSNIMYKFVDTRTFTQKKTITSYDFNI